MGAEYGDRKWQALLYLDINSSLSKTHDCQTVNSRNRLLLVYQLFSFVCVFNQREYTWAILFATVGSACVFSELRQSCIMHRDLNGENNVVMVMATTTHAF